MRTMNATDVFCFSEHELCCCTCWRTIKHAVLFATAPITTWASLACTQWFKWYQWHVADVTFQQRFISMSNDLENYIKYESLSHLSFYLQHSVLVILNHTKKKNKYGWQAYNTRTHDVSNVKEGNWEWFLAAVRSTAASVTLPELQTPVLSQLYN